jgi:hypothetical protein
MFGTIERPPTRAMPRWIAIVGVMFGMFNLGLVADKLLMGAKPAIDWFTTITQLFFTVFCVIVCVVYSGKGDATTKQ